MNALNKLSHEDPPAYTKAFESLRHQFGDDQQAFLYADCKLRMKYGLALSDDHEQAVKAQHFSRFPETRIDKPF